MPNCFCCHLDSWNRHWGWKQFNYTRDTKRVTLSSSRKCANRSIICQTPANFVWSMDGLSFFYMEFTVYCWARQDKMWKSKIIFHFISDSEQLPITWVSSTPLESLQKLASAATSSAWLGQVARVMEHVTRDFTRDVTRDTCSPWWWQSDEMFVSSDSNPFFLGLCPLSQKRT